MNRMLSKQWKRDKNKRPFHQMSHEYKSHYIFCVKTPNVIKVEI